MEVTLLARNANNEPINPKSGTPSGKRFEVEDRSYEWVKMGNWIEASLEDSRSYGTSNATTYLVMVRFDRDDVLKILRQAIAAGMLPQLQTLQQASTRLNERLEECMPLLAQIDEWFASLAGNTTAQAHTNI